MKKCQEARSPGTLEVYALSKTELYIIKFLISIVEFFTLPAGIRTKQIDLKAEIHSYLLRLKKIPVFVQDLKKISDVRTYAIAYIGYDEILTFMRMNESW